MIWLSIGIGRILVFVSGTIWASTLGGLYIIDADLLSSGQPFGASGPAKSQTSQNTLTADEAVREALSANRDLQAARFAIERAQDVP